MTIAVLGEALIDLIAGEGNVYNAHLGGSPFNVAIGLARQGMPVCYLSPFSDDSFGDQLHDALLREGVSLPVVRRSRCPTSLALVTLDEQGYPSYRLYREGIADKDTSFEEIMEHLPQDVSVFHTGSLAITPSQLSKIRQVFSALRERGVLISLDINIRLRGSLDVPRYLAGVRSLLPEADFVKASDEDIDAFALYEDARKSAAALYSEMGGGILVLTEGKGGAILFGAQGELSKRAYPIAAVADTVGAGDTFHAAFLATLCRKQALASRPDHISMKTLDTALDHACAAAAINVSRVGCAPPTERELNEFVAASVR